MNCLTRRASAGAILACVALIPTVAAAETVRLQATADVWLSAFSGEQEHTAGRYNSFKLKSIQEMALIRFDAAGVRGREVIRARLVFRRAGEDLLRYVRVSTVNGDWVEGTNDKRLAPGDGASFHYADNATRRPWSWAGSQACDVIMGSGNTLTAWAQRKELPDGWVSVELPARLIYALVAGDSDGVAVMDGGTPKFVNNFIHSVQSASPPYVEVELGGKLQAAPARPAVRAAAAPASAQLASGAIEVTIQPDADVFCWRVRLDGKPLPRWRVPHPAAKGPTTFVLDELAPSRPYRLEVSAVGAGGTSSPPAEVTVASSAALAAPPKLARFADPPAGAAPPAVAGRFRAWACPPLVKVSPVTGQVMYADAAGAGANAVWDGKAIRLFGARGEYVSCQLIIENLADGPLEGVSVAFGPLTGPQGARIAGADVELYRNWYARNAAKQWQPAYCVPLAAGDTLRIPDPARKLPDQRNQGVYVDVYVPKTAPAGAYSGSATVSAGGASVSLPVSLEVLDFALPDELCFWPQLNTYSLSEREAHDFYRLAHQHRSVLFYRRWTPKLAGAGRDIRVIWDDYDRRVGPLLSGEAFRSCRRAGVPVEAVSLPYFDSWPTELTKETYNYPGYWPKKGDDRAGLVTHYMTAPYIGDALSRDYKDAFTAVQRQFVEHFKAKGWDRTEMQCIFVGKNTHRTDFGVNMWWTTDEPYHWDDWLALQFFGRLWMSGRRVGEEKQWVFRADISRPQWQGRVLDGAVDVVHFGTGASGDAAMIHRCRELSEQAPLSLRTYGSANRDDSSNLGSVVWIVGAYLNGSSAALPWQAMGSDKALDAGDPPGGGNALLAPGGRFGTAPVADMRLKAFRDAEQLAEYFNIVADKYNLNRRQLRAMVAPAVDLRARTAAGAAADNADALRFGKLSAWQMSQLRRTLAQLITAGT